MLCCVVCVFFLDAHSFVHTGDKAVSGYDKKKYVCKLLYMFLLGIDIGTACALVILVIVLILL